MNATTASSPWCVITCLPEPSCAALPNRRRPVDVSGAGDSMLAAASLAITIENNLAKASLIGSLAAAIQISRIGNIPIEKEKIISLLQK